MEGRNMDNSIGKKLFRVTLTIVIVSVIAKLTSFISEIVLAACLGSDYRGDAYYMVSNIQMVIYPSFSVGIWKVFLPLYKGKSAQGRMDGANTITNQTISFFFITASAAVVLLILFAEPLVSLVAPGFPPQANALCVKLVRLSAPMYLFIAIAAVYAAILQANNRFFGSQVREVASHIPTILAALFCYQKWGTEALAIALAVGGLVRLLIELPFVNWGYRFHPDFRFRSSDFRLMLRRLPAALTTEGISQLNALIDKAMASTLPEGTISALNYGHKLVNVFSGLLSGSIATALYPQTIEMIALKKTEELGRLISKIIVIFLVMMVPLTTASVLFRKELVTAVFQRGSFSADSTSLTAGIFAMYSLGLFFNASNAVISNVYYGFGDTRIPMIIGMVSLAANTVLNVILIHLFRANGLALATSLAVMITFILRLALVRKYVRLNYHRMLQNFLKILVASAVACFVPRILFWLCPANHWLTLIASLLLGVGIYYSVVRLFRVKELDDLLNLVTERLRKNSRY